MFRPGVGRRREPGGADPGCIPNTGFGGVEPDVRVGKQVVLKALQQERGATWLAGDVCVIEERAHTLVGEEVGLHGTQGGATPSANRAGISGSPCSPASACSTLSGLRAASGFRV